MSFGRRAPRLTTMRASTEGNPDLLLETSAPERKSAVCGCADLIGQRAVQLLC